MKRFERVYRQGTLDVIEILVDNETGVNYLWRDNGNAAGLTVLLDENGQPIVTKKK